jgi:CRP-like cAMP-binding protein
MIPLDFLEKVAVFKELDDNQLTTVQTLCQEVGFARGERIFETGETPKYLWVVLEGEVALQWELPGRSALPETTISILRPQKTFGWSSLVPPYKYRLSAYCGTRTCKLIKVEREGLTGLFETDPAIGYKAMTRLLAIVGARFLSLQDEIAKRRGSDIMNQW